MSIVNQTNATGLGILYVVFETVKLQTTVCFTSCNFDQKPMKIQIFRVHKMAYGFYSPSEKNVSPH